jgi:hypothetical protein
MFNLNTIQLTYYVIYMPILSLKNSDVYNRLFFMKSRAKPHGERHRIHRMRSKQPASLKREECAVSAWTILADACFPRSGKTFLAGIPVRIPPENSDEENKETSG